MTLMGTYGTDLALRTEINRYMVSEDPYGRPASPFARCGAVERTAQEAGRRRMADLASATVTFPLR